MRSRSRTWPLPALALIVVLFAAFRWGKMADTELVYEIRLPGGWNFLSEDPNLPEMKEFRKKEELDRITALNGDECKLYALLEWAKTAVRDSRPPDIALMPPSTELFPG